MSIPTIVRPLAIGAAALALIGGVAAGPGRADVVVADSSDQGTLIAGSTVAAPRSGPQAFAALPRGIVVTNHGGMPVALFAPGLPALRKARPGRTAATFTGLRAGTAYTVVVGGRSLGRVVAVDLPAAATTLTVHATASPGVVTATWRYRELARTGGAKVAFTLAASAPGLPTVTTKVGDVRRTTLAGLDPTGLYTFTVTPWNSAGKGRPKVARMTKTLAQLTGTVATPTAPAPTPTPAPAPTPTPPPAPPQPPIPTTRTIYVCPTDYAENSSGTCTRTLPYTYHLEQSGPAPLLNSYETQDPACPTGYNLEDYNWIMYCRLYGPPPMASVKDATPAGYTDNGTAWTRTVPKEAVVVPA